MTATAQRTENQTVPGLPEATRLFEWGAVGTAALVVTGAHNDAWAHNHGRVDGTFFTVYHALLYTGVAVAGGYFGLRVLMERRNGRHWRRALPAGYGLALAGVGLFLLFGGLDLGWHEAFGIEASTSALFSPTHLGLMLSGALIAAGPLRAARHRGDGYAGVPAILSAAMVLSLLWFFLQFNLPFGEVQAARPALPGHTGGQGETAVKLGADAILIATVTVMGFLLYLAGTFKLRPGTVTLLLVVPAVQDTWIIGPPHPQYLVGAALVGGLVGDAVLASVGVEGPRLRYTAALIPVGIWAAYFAAVYAGYGQVHYQVHVWTGCLAISGATGWLLSVLAVLGQTGKAPKAA